MASWIEKKLSECFKLRSGDGLTKKAMVEGAYPVYGGNGIAGMHNDFNLSGNNVVIGRVGALCGIARHINKNIWLTDNAFKIVDFKYDFANDFLTYLLNFKNLRSLARQAAQPVISNSSLKDLVLKFPVSIAEQKRIVAILDEAFARIDAAVANTESNRANGRELFESYLNGVFTQKGDSWVEKALSDVCNITSKLVDPRESEFIDMPHLGAGNMVSMTGELIDIQTAREEGLKSGKFTFDENMVLYSKIRPYLMKVCRADFTGLCSADVYPLLPDAEHLDRNYLFHLLLSRHFTDYAIAGSDRAGMPKVNRPHLFKYRASFPAVSEQRRIASQLDDLAQEIRHLETIYQQKLKALTELKQSILQKAFAGELTTVPEKEIEEASA